MTKRCNDCGYKLDKNNKCKTEYCENNEGNYDNPIEEDLSTAYKTYVNSICKNVVNNVIKYVDTAGINAELFRELESMLKIMHTRKQTKQKLTNKTETN